MWDSKKIEFTGIFLISFLLGSALLGGEKKPQIKSSGVIGGNLYGSEITTFVLNETLDEVYVYWDEAPDFLWGSLSDELMGNLKKYKIRTTYSISKSKEEVVSESIDILPPKKAKELKKKQTEGKSYWESMGQTNFFFSAKVNEFDQLKPDEILESLSSYFEKDTLEKIKDNHVWFSYWDIANHKEVDGIMFMSERPGPNRMYYDNKIAFLICQDKNYFVKKVPSTQVAHSLTGINQRSKLLGYFIGKNNFLLIDLSISFGEGTFNYTNSIMLTIMDFKERKTRGSYEPAPSFSYKPSGRHKYNEVRRIGDIPDNLFERVKESLEN